MILFIDFRQGSKYVSWVSFIYEIMLALDNFSPKSDSPSFEKVMRNKNWNVVIDWSDSVWCYSLNNILVTQIFLLSIFRSILCYLTKYGFKGSQQLHASRAV